MQPHSSPLLNIKHELFSPSGRTKPAYFPFFMVQKFFYLNPLFAWYMCTFDRKDKWKGMS